MTQYSLKQHLRKWRIVENPMDLFEEVQEGRWKPKNGDEYYYIDDMWDTVDVVRHNNDVDDSWYSCWNRFQTPEQAQAYKYLVEHEQRLCDNWDTLSELHRDLDKKGIPIRTKTSLTRPSKWYVPADWTINQKKEHEKKLRLVYPYLFK